NGRSGAAVAACDRALEKQTSFTIVVHARPNNPPILSQPADMTVLLGEVVEQKVIATDPDGDRVDIWKISGPEYVTLLPGAVTQAAPGAGDLGSATVTIRATGEWEGLADRKCFAVTAVAGDFPPPCAPSTFIPRTNSFGSDASFGSTTEVQRADLNGDGVLDLVADMPQAGRVVVALGAGDGTFGPSTDLIAGSWPVSGAIADFNGDGILDIAIVNSDEVGLYRGGISIFLGDGTGGFGPKQLFSIGQGGTPQSIVAADVDRDGKIDLVTANEQLGRFSVLHGVGDGTFVW